jgi:alkyl hydroperoxide reductase subunit AhpC
MMDIFLKSSSRSEFHSRGHKALKLLLQKDLQHKNWHKADHNKKGLAIIQSQTLEICGGDGGD